MSIKYKLHNVNHKPPLNPATNLVFLKNDIHPSAEIKKLLLSLLITIVQIRIHFNIQIRELLLLKEALEYVIPQRENLVVIFL